MTGTVVDSLYLYPVKGCAGIEFTAAHAATTGLVAADVADREWMVIDSDGRFLTQRELPRFALIRPRIDGDGLWLDAPGASPLAVDRSAVAPSRAVVVWRSHVRGIDAGDEAARWLSACLGCEVRLVRFDRSVVRACNPQFVGTSGAHTYFADGYPLLVVGAASLADLNARLAARGEPALPMDRFRPSLVVAGLDAFAEDHVDTFTIGDVVLRAVKPCIRCHVTTIDQATSTVGIEPLRTLGEYRMREDFAGIAFGVNAIVVREGSLARGAPVDVDWRF